MRSTLLLIIALAAGCAEHPSTEVRKEASLNDLVGRANPPAAKADPKAATKAEAAAHAPSGPAPLEALTRLSAGNARFANEQRRRSADTTDDAEERAATAKGQHPFAAVLTCADSRVPPELLFDQSIGDLFVVRNAGNVAEPIGEGSLEYAVEHLGVRLIVVLGHASCGAVKAISGTEGPLPGHLADIQRAMPGLRDFALERGKAGATPDGVIAAAVERNASSQAAALLAGSAVLRQAVADGRIAVVPGVYDLSSGVVGFLPPSQAAKSTTPDLSGEAPAHSGH
jgi:carbonic anhydrase